ncbi:hypothetical protein [Paenibacillus pinihumi]|uniref:hypothetical protein n=1 Tax=Paenibacillus pinihumi TaxID=669462 RepID=UPI0003F7E37F|nr:hypothetical protein [Paenibacillus pinihumi]
MYSEKGLKKFAIICIIMSVIVFGFACYGLVLLSDHRHLLATDFDLLFFFGAFSVIALCVQSVAITLLSFTTRKSLGDEAEKLRTRIIELEKKIKS